MEAQRALGAAFRGQVAAVFQNSFYVRSGDSWACFGGRALGRGPLNVPCSGAPQDWRSAAKVGLAASIRCGVLNVSGLKISLDGAPVWVPVPPPPPDLANPAGGIAALSRWLPKSIPEGGLAAFLRQHVVPRTRVERAAWPAVEALSGWAGHPAWNETKPPLPAVCALLGLGPGLTPSGDDFLAGFMVALRAVGHAAPAGALSRIIIRNASLTTHLSAAHLRAIARSGLNEDLDALLAAILAGDVSAIRKATDDLHSANVHHSPWDAAAGIATALRGAITRRPRHRSDGSTAEPMVCRPSTEMYEVGGMSPRR